LCGDQSGRKNYVRFGGIDSSCFFNGYDSGEFPVDGDDELMCGATLFTRLGGDFYDNMVLFKRSQTIVYDVDRTKTASFIPYVVATNIGCVAPLTLQLCDIGFDIANNIRKHVLIWLSANGLAMWDGISVSIISDAFKELFDAADTTNQINPTYIHLCSGVFDPIEMEYHLFYPKGSSATAISAEKVYSLRQQSPFDVSRGTGKALQCAFPVEDSAGNKYIYGGTNDGYIERLEYGTTFDGKNMVYTIQPADICLGGKAMIRTRLMGVQLIGKIKSTTTAKITATHYADGVTSGTVISSAISQNKTGYRIFRVYIPCNGAVPDGIFHSVKFSITTNNETRGFEPLLVSYAYQELGQVYNEYSTLVNVDGNAWIEVAPKLGAETAILSLAVYNSKLYGGTYPNGKLYEWNGIDAWVEVAPQLGAETQILSLAVYNSKLYGGTVPNGKLYEYYETQKRFL